MTTISLTETPVSFVSVALSVPGAVAQALRKALARRLQRKSIAALLEMEQSRLDDLGISLGDVREALRGRSPAGSHLEARRREWALAWPYRADTRD
jgi:uncharacterized protein YjiS (DUF1127 family)